MHVRKLLLVEPLVRFPVKINKGETRSDIGMRLGYLYLAGFLREHLPNIEVSVLPLRYLNLEGVPHNLEAEIAAADMIGVGAVTCEYPHASYVLDAAKKQGKLTVLGGYFPTFNRDIVLNRGNADFVVRGQGEETLLELILALNSGADLRNVDGLSFNKDGTHFHNKPRGNSQRIDGVKPAYDLIDMKGLRELTSAQVYSLRGCYARCAFCTVTKFWGRYSTRSPVGVVIDQLRMYREYGYKDVNFKDETILQDRIHATALFDAIVAEGLTDLRYKVKARLNELDSSAIEMMRRANVRSVQVGIESVTQDVLNRYHKGIRMDDVDIRIQQLVDAGMEANVIFMLGLAGETPESLAANEDFIMKLSRRPNVRVYMTINTPHPGDYQWNKSERLGLRIISGDINEYTHKRLVALPVSLGQPHAALDRIVATQHRLSDALPNGERDNPKVDMSYILRHNPHLDNRKAITHPWSAGE